MDLRRRLEHLDRSGALGQAPPPSRAPRALEELLPGSEVKGARGSFFLCRHELPRDHRHGRAQIAQAGCFPTRWLPHLGRDLEEMDPERVLFVDTETTGLSGGTGTYAFLIGLAWIEPDRICVEQLFMREHAEEGAVLEHLARRLEDCGGVVSFNGKTFDLPLLQTRFMMKRLRVDLEGLPHLDLLHPSRRLWAHGLPDCRLETLEHRILGAPRTSDVPGMQIPDLYFRYLRTGDGRGLARVAEHNRLDLLALMGVAAALAEALEDPLSGRRPEEDYGLGRMLAAMGHGETGRALLARALEGPLPVQSRRPALLHLARLQRREGDRHGAANLWNQVLDEEPAHPEAAEEMAKHLEHQVRDYRGALILVERVLGRRDLTASRRQGLERRRERLRRRLDGEESRPMPPREESAAGG